MQLIDSKHFSAIKGAGREDVAHWGAVGAGVAASEIIGGAYGGLAALNAAGYMTVAGAAFAGLFSSAYLGWNFGSYVYEHSETVQNGAIGIFSFGGQVYDQLFVSAGEGKYRRK